MASVPLRLARAGQCGLKGFRADPVPAGQIVQVIVENSTSEDANSQKDSHHRAEASACSEMVSCTFVEQGGVISIG